MRCLTLLLLLSPAWALTPGDARHLLGRTGFAPTQGEIEALLPLTRDQAVERVLGAVQTRAQTPAPNWVGETEIKKPAGAGKARRMKLRKRRRRQVNALAGWWVQEMLVTRSPLTERMTLFWHGHLPSSWRKVKNPALLYRQNVLLRRHALGSYRDLLHAITTDAAMLRYLDGARNRRGQPNENYARELMELFTVGEGAYTEQDVRETARALTGWIVDRKTGEVRFRKRRFDAGPKTIRGRTGDFDAKAVVDMLLDDPRTAQRLARKLCRHFVADAVDPALEARVAERLRVSGLDMRQGLRVVLQSEAFWAARGHLVKSPIELVVGAARQLGVDRPPVRLARMAGNLGQAIFHPPNVKGWPGGNAWVSDATYVAREATLRRLLRGPLLGYTQRDAQAVVSQLLPVPPVDVEVLDAKASAALVRQLVLDPAYQVN